MLNIEDAAHEETASQSSTLIISKLTCSLVGKTESVHIKPDSQAHLFYGLQEVREQFSCNYGLNPEFQNKLAESSLTITGVDADGGVRIVELPDHLFYMATLFLPQVSSFPETPHPLMKAFLDAASVYQKSGNPESSANL